MRYRVETGKTSLPINLGHNHYVMLFTGKYYKIVTTLYNVGLNP